MSLCYATKQELMAEGHSVTGNCPVEGCGLPVARHRDENASELFPITGATAGDRSTGLFSWIYGWFFGDERSNSIAALSTAFIQLRHELKETKNELNQKVDETKNQLSQKVDETKNEFSQKVDETKNELSQKVDDSVAILPDRYKELVRLASVNIFDGNGRSIGVAIFISKRRIISALHIFQEHYGFGNKKNVRFNLKTVIYGLLHRPNEQEEQANFRMVDYKGCWDLAVLELVDSYADSSHFVALPAIGSNDSKVNKNNSLAKLAVTSFTSALANQVPDAVDVSFCVCPAALLKVSKHHLLYTSSLFSGDSGGAILLSHDGSLRGVHQKSVNQASDELRRCATPDEMVQSINSLINGLSTGFIGLRLDVADVQSFIFK